MFKINSKKTGSINDGGRSLKVGTYPYVILGAALVAIKSDPTGKSKHVAIDLQLVNDPSYTCKEFLAVLDKDDTRRNIAERTLVGFFDAAGCKIENLTTEHLKLLKGKEVLIEVVEKRGKGENKDKVFTNIRTIEPYDGDADEGEEEEAEEAEDEADEADEEEEDGDDGEEDADDSEEEEEEEEEEDDTPPPAKKPSGKPSGKPSKTPAKTSKPAAAAPAKKRPW